MEPERTPAQRRAGHQFDWRHVPHFIALVGGASIALAVARQIGFFSTLDIGLLSLLSVDDVLRNSLSVVPITIFACALGIALGRSGAAPPLRRAMGWMFSSKSPSFEIRFGILIACLSVVFARSWPVWVLLWGSFASVAVVNWYRRRGEFSETVRLAVIGFWTLITAFLLGAMEGQSALRSTDRNYELTLASGATSEVRLLRVTSEGLLVIRETRVVEVVPRHEVVLLKRRELPLPGPMVPLADVWAWTADAWDRLAASVTGRR